MKRIDFDGLDGILGAPLDTSATAVLPRTAPQLHDHRSVVVTLTIALAGVAIGVVAGLNAARATAPAPAPVAVAALAMPSASTAPAPSQILVAAQATTPAPSSTSFTPAVFPGSFDVNGVKPGTVDAGAVDGVARALAGCRHIRLVGHTCDLGTRAVNDQIGLARAVAAKQALERAGVDGARIEVASAGSREPVASNATAGGRRANRRVVVTCDDSTVEKPRKPT